MASKVCKKCGAEKPVCEFYEHKLMKSGYLNKCKACTKDDVAKRRTEKIDEIRAYDRARGNRLPKGYMQEYRERFPNKHKAHTMVAKHVRAGNLASQPCEICKKEQTVAHHDDYAKPLNVRWLCVAHHQQWHSANGEGLNP